MAGEAPRKRAAHQEGILLGPLETNPDTAQRADVRRLLERQRVLVQPAVSPVEKRKTDEIARHEARLRQVSANFRGENVRFIGRRFTDGVRANAARAAEADLLTRIQVLGRPLI